MKLTFFLPLVLGAGLIAGCKSTSSTASSSDSSAKSASTEVAKSISTLDTTALVAAFRNADTETVKVVQEVVTSVSKKDWSGASAKLQSLRRIPGLTGAQADSVKALLASLSAK